MNHHQPNEPEDLIAAAINAAEDIRSPLDGRVEQTATDPGAPFASDVLARLAALKKDDRAAFELRRSRLKKGDCRVTALDEAIAKENGDVGGRGPTQADILIGLAASAELFHTRVLPVAGDGSKRPGVSNWKPFQTTRPAAEGMRALVQSLVRARHEVSA